ncbi:CU044_2847 family protein [Micromonospora sp. NPDC000668]|uniref:CU044_2847 family protein n=1 Tax=Micromonospora sp. NPDC000668 TaxID=3364219 RepID=UPI0036BB85AB
MNELMRFETASGSVVVEVAEGEPGFERVAREGIVADAGRKLEGALQDVRDAAESALGVFRDGSLRPDGIELEFGVKLNAEAGAILAKSAVEGHFTVKLCWQRQATRGDEGDPREADSVQGRAGG